MTTRAILGWAVVVSALAFLCLMTSGIVWDVQVNYIMDTSQTYAIPIRVCYMNVTKFAYNAFQKDYSVHYTMIFTRPWHQCPCNDSECVTAKLLSTFDKQKKGSRYADWLETTPTKDMVVFRPDARNHRTVSEYREPRRILLRIWRAFYYTWYALVLIAAALWITFIVKWSDEMAFKKMR
jgi:hypothetical protein